MEAKPLLLLPKKIKGGGGEGEEEQEHEEDRKERKRKAREEKAAEKERLKKAKVEQASAGPAELPTKSTDDRPICIHCRERFDPKDYRLPYACFGNRRKSPAQARTQVN